MKPSVRVSMTCTCTWIWVQMSSDQQKHSQQQKTHTSAGVFNGGKQRCGLFVTKTMLRLVSNDKDSIRTCHSHSGHWGLLIPATFNDVWGLMRNNFLNRSHIWDATNVNLKCQLIWLILITSPLHLAINKVSMNITNKQNYSHLRA